ncbi:hypothetical protein BTS2_0503 [Bacillus sp. TS-2]|nr:hypothetical protein BTS2_0503 [Bacillus sp. TS-2]
MKKKIETWEQRKKAQDFILDYAERSKHPLFDPTDKEKQIFDATLKAVADHNDRICTTYPPLDDEPQQEPQGTAEEPKKDVDLSGWI